MIGRRALILIVLLALCTTSLLAQGDDRIQRIIDEGLQPITLGDVLYETDFSASGKWESAEVGSIVVGVEDDAYRIENTTSNQYVRGVYDETFDNTVLVVETTQLSDELDNGYGVVCRADPQDEASGYVFFISGDGYARIFAFEDGSETELASWSSNTDINQGQDSNELIVVCDNSYLALYINGELALEAESDLYSEGAIGFMAASYVAGTSVNIAYDDLRVFSSSGEADASSTEIPQTLENYDGEWQDAVAELQDTGLIASGGQLIFSENRAFMDSTVGANFYPLASNSNYADVVFGGEMNVTLPADDTILCGFLSRVQLDPTGQFAISDFEVSIVNMLGVVVSSINGDNVRSETADLDLPLDEPVHILYLLQDDRATVYINGELVLSNFLITDVGGFHGIVLRSEMNGGRCEGNNMWAYYAPVFEAGVCEASAGGDVNQRSGPGTNFDRAGTLPAGTALQVVGQSTGADGLIWWQLENDNWVREDVVNVVGDCANIPEVDG